MGSMLRNWGLPSTTLLGDLQRELNRVFEGVGGEGASEGVVSGFAPRTNLAETDKSFEVSVELPGLKSEDIQIEFRDGHLWITGERKQFKEEKGKTFHRVESQYGQFRRVIALGADVDSDKIEAGYSDGVLSVTVPKAQAAQPKRIVVKS